MSALLTSAAIGVGGAAGAVLRYWLSLAVTRALAATGFPAGTLAVNALGSFLIGLLSVVLMERLAQDPVWRALVLVGLLGGFTTFSTFSLETIKLLESGRLVCATANILASVLLCLVFAWIGLVVGRRL